MGGGGRGKETKGYSASLGTEKCSLSASLVTEQNEGTLRKRVASIN